MPTEEERAALQAEADRATAELFQSEIDRLNAEVLEILKKNSVVLSQPQPDTRRPWWDRLGELGIEG